MRGNSAILKCSIPSFVADFVHVVSWLDDSGEEIMTSEDFNESKSKSNQFNPNSFVPFYYLLFNYIIMILI